MVARRAALGSAAMGIALATACGGDSPATELPPTATDATTAARVYLDSAITVMQNVAFYRTRVDWPAVRAQARTMAAGASTFAATYPAIRYALGALGDRHSFLQPPVAADAAAPLLLGVVALAASWAPARRAARVELAVALRHE